MDIVLVTPAKAGTRVGNRNTANRWATLLRALGHRVRVQVQWDGRAAEAMIALHARRSHAAIAAWADRYPDRPLAVVLTGTDLYRDIDCDAAAQRSLELATRLVMLHDPVDGRLRRYRDKLSVVVQSAPRITRPAPLRGVWEVVVSGHLRDEKDPFRTVAALGHIPPSLPVRVTHLGGALDPTLERVADEWMAKEPRYRWLGEKPHGAALRHLVRARLMVISSKMEGGANVVCEALANGVPILASRVPGNVGLLGPDHPGYFPRGNERALARLIRRAVTDAAYLRALQRAGAKRRARVTPSAEQAALARLVRELQSASSERCDGPLAASRARRTGAKLRR